MKIMRRKGRQTKQTERVTAKTAEAGGSPGLEVGGGEGEEEKVGKQSKRGGREGGSHVRSHVSGKGKKVGSGYRVRDWPEA